MGFRIERNKFVYGTTQNISKSRVNVLNKPVLFVLEIKLRIGYLVRNTDVSETHSKDRLMLSPLTCFHR